MFETTKTAVKKYSLLTSSVYLIFKYTRFPLFGLDFFFAFISVRAVDCNSILDGDKLSWFLLTLHITYIIIMRNRAFYIKHAIREWKVYYSKN